MEFTKSLDKQIKLISVMLVDIQMSHSITFTKRACRLDIQKIEKRIAREGVGFLTKTLPRLGKHFDKVLAGQGTLDAPAYGFASERGSKLPRFLGKLFQSVLTQDGEVLPSPCVDSIRHIRTILYLFYKWDVPYAPKQEQKVIDQFIQTERDIIEHDRLFSTASGGIYGDTVVDDPLLVFASNSNASRYRSQVAPYRSLGYINPIDQQVLPIPLLRLVRKARHILSDVFSSFDPYDIVPSHGPGAVSTRERLWAKYDWSHIPSRLTDVYPLDAYFYASLGHVCDEFRGMDSIVDHETPARVILVPKDSRGPRLISCEPLYFQWIQQGLGRAIVRHVEQCDAHDVRHSVHFTDQSCNQCGALLGSVAGKYATLDLKEASDRVTDGLVRLLFPPHLYRCMEACRSRSTLLPNGEELTLRKFAPMGSCLCFPVMALTIWSLLRAAATDADTRECILVYGDDVIVKRHFAADAIETLESVGLLCNRDKCCTDGLFRESCGVDAYKGSNVTPLRFRKGMPSFRRPGLYPSSIRFANALYDRGYFSAYEYFTKLIYDEYGRIPSDDMGLTAPSLREVPLDNRPNVYRINRSLQKKEWKVRDVKSPRINHVMNGWKMLLRYFCEGSSNTLNHAFGSRWDARHIIEHSISFDVDSPFSASIYTKRDTTKIVYAWR
jgi:hypothetical protein